LIKSAASDVPRIDFSDSTNGALLLEPQSTNLITYSESTNNWAVNGNITVTSNATISPEGVNNAVKLQNITTSSYNQCVGFAVPSLSGVSVVGKTYSASIYIKPVNASDVGKFIELSIQRAGGDFESLSVNVEITSTDWKRYVITYTFTGAGSGNQTGATFKILRSSTTIDDIYVFGVQFEESSFATSYIPSLSGSTTTRLADVCNNSGSAQDFNSEEGVLYAEIAALHDSGHRFISVNSSNSSNRITIELFPQTGTLVSRLTTNGVQKAFLVATNIVKTNMNKIAVRYYLNNFSLWVNGSKLSEDLTDVPVPIGLNRLDFSQGNNSGYFYGKVKDLQVFTTALTDEQLAALTTI